MLKKVLIIGFPALLLVACSSVFKRASGDGDNILTERTLWRLHRDVPYTHFEYADGSRSEGLLLRWKPDSILVQPRETDLPVKIPASGVIRIKIEVGNRIWEALTIGTIAAGGYFGLAGSYDLSGVTLGEAIWKVLVPPVILVTSIAIGSGMDKYEEYILPEELEFDYDEANSLYELLE